MQVKICGVCSARDAAFAVESGADYVGGILTPGFARSLDSSTAGEVYASAKGARRVAVFVDADEKSLASAANAHQLDVLQLHGNEPPELCSALRAGAGVRVWKALAVRDSASLAENIRRFAGCVDGVMLDGAKVAGSSVKFDWRMVCDVRRHLARDVMLIVAGGLNPENVTEVIELVSPDVVDVSSGVESSVRNKSHELIRAFVANARGGIPLHGARS